LRRTPRAKSPKSRSKSPARVLSNSPDNSWIRTIATPYLRGYRAVAESCGSLRGYRFHANTKSGSKASSGFFVGYLIDSADYEFLQTDPPECAVFAFIEPLNSVVYRKLVTPEGSLLRQTAEYIGWLTHRPPRFAFFENRTVVLVRHFSMRKWPAAKHHHFSRNFFIETLAWLVRSGLVAKLASQSIAPSAKPSS
jgi:hypothetical protein